MICLWQWKYFFILLLPNFFHNWVFLWLSSRVFLLTQKPKPSCKVPIWHSGWHTWETLLCLPSGMIGKAKRPFFRVKKPQLTAVVVLFSTRDRKLHFVQNFFHTVRKDLNLANKKFVITHIKDFHWKLGRMLEISEICADLCKELHLFRIYSSHQNTYRTLVMEKIFVFWNTVFLTHNQFAET